VALEFYKESPRIQILIDRAFSINTHRNYVIDSFNYTHHLHKELVYQAKNYIKTRDEQGILTHIGKVTSHTGVIYNDEADVGARGVVNGDIPPDITFTTANPPPSVTSELGP
jgi:hypothetical protein